MYNNSPQPGNGFLTRNANLARAVAALFRRLDYAPDAAALQIVHELQATLRASGLSFSQLGNTIEKLPFNSMVNDWQALLTVCSNHYDQLSPKEQGFVDTLTEWDG